uniref:Uncharacterized protein n=1 Tax=Heterorhabditis bacteriophora TaxID=37862 RepID=A0A1I7XTY5_HETBA
MSSCVNMKRDELESTMRERNGSLTLSSRSLLPICPQLTPSQVHNRVRVGNMNVIYIGSFSRAWRLLICAVVDLIREGFEQQVRQLKRKHSFNAHTQYFENMERQNFLDIMNATQSKKLDN